MAASLDVILGTCISLTRNLTGSINHLSWDIELRSLVLCYREPSCSKRHQPTRAIRMWNWSWSQWIWWMGRTLSLSPITNLFDVVNVKLVTPPITVGGVHNNMSVARIGIPHFYLTLTTRTMSDWEISIVEEVGSKNIEDDNTPPADFVSKKADGLKDSHDNTDPPPARNVSKKTDGPKDSESKNSSELSKNREENLQNDAGSQGNILDSRKQQLLENRWMPPVGYDFPYSIHSARGLFFLFYLTQHEVYSLSTALGLLVGTKVVVRKLFHSENLLLNLYGTSKTC
ncbi:hypothetical protein FOCC_FOCC015739 [Frankliniella occidentalis]|nr:hypothetical protein FOCC_FOCC015739 [Frankliniella occidentalis]